MVHFISVSTVGAFLNCLVCKVDRCCPNYKKSFKNTRVLEVLGVKLCNCLVRDTLSRQMIFSDHDRKEKENGNLGAILPSISDSNWPTPSHLTSDEKPLEFAPIFRLHSLKRTKTRDSSPLGFGRRGFGKRSKNKKT